MRTVTIHRVHFLEDSVYDGDYTPIDTVTDVYPVTTILAAVEILKREGLTFAATGADWAGDPDGSYIVNYSTAERVETSGHLAGFTDGQEIAIASLVG